MRRQSDKPISTQNDEYQYEKYNCLKIIDYTKFKDLFKGSLVVGKTRLNTVFLALNSHCFV